jgi:exopolysaccharide production protein ExoZ
MPTGPPLLTTIHAVHSAVALAVVLCHVGAVLGDPFHGVLRAGHAGVDFFFMLSGFIIATVHHKDVRRPSRLRAYLCKRLARIYPLYWIATGVVIGLSTGGLASLVHHNPARLLSSLLLFPQHTDPVLAVARSLQHEMLFSLAFGLLILHRAVGVTLLAAWACFIVATTASAPAVLPWAPANLLRDFIGSSSNLEFAFSLAVAVLARRGRERRPCPLSRSGQSDAVRAVSGPGDP